MTAYLPNRGDIIWLNFIPQAGHEQAGKIPAIVLSPKEYNRKTHLLLACPITSRVKGYPFEVPLESKKVQGVVLSDQVKSLDWKVRKVEFVEKADESIVAEIQDKLLLLIK
jgi:mRNA interferase MazF